MKFKITILLATFFIVGQLYAQNFPMSLGAYISYSAGINANSTPRGIKNDIGFNNLPDFGASFYYPLVKDTKLGAQLDLAYITHSYVQKFNCNLCPNQNFHLNYFQINPSIYISGFLVGINFDIPVSGKKEDSDIAKSKLNTLIAVNLAYEILLYANETGRIVMFFEGNYSFTGSIKDFKRNDPMGSFADDSFSPRPASLGLGFKYMFNIGRVQ
ncbi:MAG TPA: hypothetical protein PLC04_07060 [Candidatus Kapabacteria bacterium]|nr:hypothetical protein [Candidatus Kapabacteria bacterium]